MRKKRGIGVSGWGGAADGMMVNSHGERREMEILHDGPTNNVVQNIKRSLDDDSQRKASEPGVEAARSAADYICNAGQRVCRLDEVSN